VVDRDAAPATALRDAIKEAFEQSTALINEGRFAQAADVLQAVIVPAADDLGAEHPQVLMLRTRRAAAFFLGGDARQALPEFDDLGAIYGRTKGTESTEALDCRRQAAYCRAELGQATAALKQFREVLDQVRANEGDASPTARDLRRNIGVLLLAENDTQAAADVLQPLYEDLCLVVGPDDDETREVADLLARLRLAES
jgi:hypothetical protein